LLVTRITEKIARKKLVKDNVIELLAKIAGWMIFTYIIAKICDTGVVPAVILISAPLRRNPVWRVTALFLGVMGVSLNRWVMVLQVMAVPRSCRSTTGPFTIPSWQEVATTILPVAYGIILIMISYRYLPIFPQEAELNPIEEEAPAPAESTTEPAAELEPAKA
jgi:Ni/Fe-hydrogenase subunit HybB-like protein